MPLPTCPEGYMVCPYEESHLILIARAQFHLVKCKKNHKESRLVECPFNSIHKVPEIELNCHKQYLCPDRKKIDTFICNTEEATPLFPVQNYEVTSSEDWDDVQVETYDPLERCKNLPILINLQGATPSDRKNFRAEERQRYRNCVGATSNHVNKKPEKAPMRLPQTTAKSQLNAADGSGSGEDSRGRGRGRILK